MKKEFINNPVAAYEKLMDNYAKLKSENEQLLKQRNKVMRKNVVLYTTLQEIKAIAECVIDNDNSLKTDHCFGACGECSSFKHCKLYPYWQITHLITKAEEE